jgi:hypothetical protein
MTCGLDRNIHPPPLNLLLDHFLEVLHFKHLLTYFP